MQTQLRQNSCRRSSTGVSELEYLGQCECAVQIARRLLVSLARINASVHVVCLHLHITIHTLCFWPTSVLHDKASSSPSLSHGTGSWILPAAASQTHERVSLKPVRVWPTPTPRAGNTHTAYAPERVSIYPYLYLMEALCSTVCIRGSVFYKSMRCFLLVCTYADALSTISQVWPAKLPSEHTPCLASS